jgi:hypothetical protein
MRLVALIAVPALLLAACGTPVDPDTVRTKNNTIKMGDSQVTTALASADRPLAPPTYLPEWAPVYPGAELKSKVVQRRADRSSAEGRPIRRATRSRRWSASTTLIIAITK